MSTSRPHPAELRSWSLSVLAAPPGVQLPDLTDEVALDLDRAVVHLSVRCLDIAADGPLSAVDTCVTVLPLLEALKLAGSGLSWCGLCAMHRGEHAAVLVLELAARLAEAALLAERFTACPDLKMLGQVVRARSALGAQRFDLVQRSRFSRQSDLPVSCALRTLDAALLAAPSSLLELLAEAVGLVHLRRTAPTREYQAVCVEGVAEGVAVLRDPSRAHRLERSLRALDGTVQEVLSDLDALLASSRPLLVAGEVTVQLADSFAEALLALVAPSGGAFVACVPSFVLPYLQEHLGGTVHPLVLPDGVEPSRALPVIFAVWDSMRYGLEPHKQLKLLPDALAAALALLEP